MYIARQNYECHALIFDYGQKASYEIECARKIAEEAGCEYQVLRVSLPWKGSSLLDENMAIPGGDASGEGAIPSTYVPARNIIFLSFGLSFAESIDAEKVFIGAHELDFSNYPDCRKEFFASFRDVIRLGTKRGTEGREVGIETPVIDKTKKEIVEIGSELGVPFQYTWSCYKEGEDLCGACESCLFRAKAFKEAGLKDPLI